MTFVIHSYHFHVLKIRLGGNEKKIFHPFLMQGIKCTSRMYGNVAGGFLLFAFEVLGSEGIGYELHPSLKYLGLEMSVNGWSTIFSNFTVLFDGEVLSYV